MLLGYNITITWQNCDKIVIKPLEKSRLKYLNILLFALHGFFINCKQTL